MPWVEWSGTIHHEGGAGIRPALDSTIYRSTNACQLNSKVPPSCCGRTSASIFSYNAWRHWQYHNAFTLVNGMMVMLWEREWWISTYLSIRHNDNTFPHLLAQDTKHEPCHTWYKSITDTNNVHSLKQNHGALQERGGGVSHWRSSQKI